MTNERIDMALRFVAAIHMEWVTLIPRLSPQYRVHAETCAQHCERVTALLTEVKAEQEADAAAVYTTAQYTTLGKLVERWTKQHGNEITFHVTPEIGSLGAMLCVVSSKTGIGDGTVNLVHGIERDGHCHT